MGQIKSQRSHYGKLAILRQPFSCSVPILFPMYTHTQSKQIYDAPIESINIKMLMLCSLKDVLCSDWLVLMFHMNWNCSFFFLKCGFIKQNKGVKGYTLFCRSNTIRPILSISISIQNFKCHNSICTYRSKFFYKTLLSSCSETQFSFFDIAVHVFLSNIL